MAEPIAALVVRILTDTSEMVTGVKTATTELDGFENRVVDTDKAVGGLTKSYRQFDGVLQSVGINLGPQVKALEDIAGAAGKSVAGVGALGTAGLLLGAGIAGWGVGRAVADFLDLDDAIAQASAELLGYGNLAAETAGAKQDVLNRAIALGADVTTTYTEAIIFLNQALGKTWAESDGVSAAIDRLVLRKQISARASEILEDQELALAAAAKKLKAETEAYDVEIAKQIVLFDNLDKAAKKVMDKKSKEDAAQGWWNAMSRSLEPQAWEREHFAEQARLDQQSSAMSSGGVVVNPGGGIGSTNVTVNAQGSWFDSPERINDLARRIEDSIATRSGLSNTYTRR